MIVKLWLNTVAIITVSTLWNKLTTTIGFQDIISDEEQLSKHFNWDDSMSQYM